MAKPPRDAEPTSIFHEFTPVAAWWRKREVDVHEITATDGPVIHLLHTGLFIMCACERERERRRANSHKDTTPESERAGERAQKYGARREKKKKKMLHPHKDVSRRA